MTKERKATSSSKSNHHPQRPAGKTKEGAANLPWFVGLSLVVFLGVAIYSNSFDASFHLDDKNSIIENGSIRDWTDVGQIWNFNKTRFIPYWTFAVNYQLGKLDVWGYHLVNLIIHLINACLVFWLTRLVFSSPNLKAHSLARHKDSIALTVAFLFVSHPLATQSVTYIVQRLAAFVALFYFLSVALYMKARLSQGKGLRVYMLYFGALVSAVLAMLSKENAFTLPIVLLLVETFLMQRILENNRWSRGRMILTISAVAAVVIFAVLQLASRVFEPIPPTGGNNFTITSGTYFLSQFPVILTYIRLLFIPVNQNLDYDFPLSESLFEATTFFSLSVLVSLMALAVYLFRKNRAVSFGIFWFFIALAIESSVVPIEDLIFEHRTYLPAFGFFLAVTSGVYQVWGERRKGFVITVFSLVVALNAIQTYNRNKNWKSELSLWSDVVSKSPGKPRAYLNRGVANWEKGNREEGFSDYQKAVSLGPKNYAQAYFNLGAAYESFGQWDLAIANYTQAISTMPQNPEAHGGMGICYSNTNKEDQAIAEFTLAISQSPNNPKYYFNRGNTYMRKKQWQEAEADFSKALVLKPDYIDAYHNRAAVYGSIGKVDKAISDCTSALAIDPYSTRALFNRAITYFNAGKWKEAISDYSALLSLSPNQKNAYYNRGIAYVNTGQWELAVADFNKVLAMDPKDQAAASSRAFAASQLAKR